MHTLVKAACAVHNLALAKALAGPIFAKMALRPALIAEITDEKERGRVLATAWTKYNVINIPAHLVFTGTWLVERGAIKDIAPDSNTRSLTRFKDVLIAGAFITGLANVAVGRMAQKDFPDGMPVSDKTSTDPKVEAYRRYFRTMGPLHLALVGTSLMVGPLIAGSIIHHERRGLLRRLFGA
jgi:hypothetical protein